MTVLLNKQFNLSDKKTLSAVVQKRKIYPQCNHVIKVMATQNMHINLDHVTDVSVLLFLCGKLT